MLGLSTPLESISLFVCPQDRIVSFKHEGLPVAHCESSRFDVILKLQAPDI
jgi:hypothetical protein